MVQVAQQCGFDSQLLGVEGHGTILSFGQVHMHPLIDRIELKLLILEAQQEILDDLLTICPERVFVEGLYNNQSSEDIRGGKFAVAQESILKSFSDYRPGQQLTTDQEGLLLNSFAPYIYLVLATEDSQSVSLLATTTEADSEWRDQANLARPWDMSLIVGERETTVMDMVQQSLKLKGGTVALIFGAGHQENWPGACGPGFQPTIYSKNYSKIFNQMIQVLEGNAEKEQKAKKPQLPYQLMLDQAKAAFERLNNPDSWSDKESPESLQMLKQLTDALDVFGLDIQGRDHELLLRYVADVKVTDKLRQQTINALIDRLSFCTPQERATILIAFDPTRLLSKLMPDPRVGCALLLHRISVTQSIEKESSNAIVSDALLLPDAHCRKVLSALDIRGGLTTNEVERASIDDALKAAKDYKRLSF